MRVLIGLALITSLVFPVFGMEATPSQLDNVGVSENVGVNVPLDISFLNQRGESVQIGDLIKNGKPTLINFVYFSCPMLCPMTLDGLVRSLKPVPYNVGDRYNLITISMDPTDTPENAMKYRSRFAEELGNGAPEHWHFLTGNVSDIKRFSKTLGFHYKYIPKTGDFAHSAALIVVSSKQKVARYLHGIEFDPFDLKMAILESGDAPRSIIERGLLFCYHYDASEKKYAMRAMQLMRLGGVLTLVFLVAFILLLARRGTSKQ